MSAKIKNTTQKCPAYWFFHLDELYAECCKYAITHQCDMLTAQFAVVGEPLFDVD